MRLAVAVAVAVAIGSLARVASADRIAADLQLDVNCADYWATPDHGVVLTLDGSPVASHGIEGADATAVTAHGYPYETWVPTDVGFTVPFGRHHISVASPGCAPLDADIDAGIAPVLVSGRLPVSEPSLMGTVGAPNGFGIAVGAFRMTHAAHVTSDQVESFAYDSTSDVGVALSVSYEHRHLALANDVFVGTASTSGAGTNLMPLGQLGESSTPVPITGSEVRIGDALRVGARLPLGSVALAAGGGLGADVWSESASFQNGELTFAAPSTETDFYIPAWASITFKPSCSFGLEAMASYDIHPADTNADAPAFLGALLWQPSAACSEPTGLTVH